MATKKAAEAATADAPEAKTEWPGPWPETLPDGLWPRLLLAQTHGGSIAKAGRNNHHNYDYVQAEDVIRDGSKILSRAGLVAKVDTWEIKLTEGSTKGGGRTVECEAKSTLWIINPDSPEEKTDFPIIGTGTDSPGDKAIYKAQTGGKKYAWQDALTLAFGDDPENSESGAAAVDQQARGRQQQQQQGPPFGEAAKSNDNARRAIAYLLAPQLADDGTVVKRAERLVEKITEEAKGYFPLIVSRSLLHVAADLKASIEQGAVEDEPQTDPPPAADEDPDVTEQAKQSEDEEPDAPAEGIESEIPADTTGLDESPDDDGGDGSAEDADFEPEF